MRPLEDITLNEVGLTATFECEVSLEGLKAEWQKANKPVKANGRISIVADKKIHRLIINDAKGEDEGEYTVVFKEQNLKSTAKLAVKGCETNSASNYYLVRLRLSSYYSCWIIGQQDFAIGVDPWQFSMHRSSPLPLSLHTVYKFFDISFPSPIFWYPVHGYDARS